MKRNATIEHQVLGICWLEEEEMQNLLIKDLIWKEGWLYAVQKWEDWDEEPFLDLLNREHHAMYEKYIWLVGEHWVPVIAGQEQILLQLIEGRSLEEHVFSEVHMPPLHVLKQLERDYASRLYTMFSGLTPPIDNRRSEDCMDDLDTSRYDEDAVYDVAHVLSYPLNMADLFAMRSIGQRSARRRKGKSSSAM